MSTTLSRLAVCALLALTARPAIAEIDGDTLIDAARGVRLELPRGWRVTDVTPYPGVLARLSRTTPRVAILVTADAIAPCNAPGQFCDPDAGHAIAALVEQLSAAGFVVTAQEQSGTPEVEYEAGRRYLRQAVVVVGDQVVSVVLAADSPAVRAAQGRVFERLVQSVRSSAPARAGAAPTTQTSR